MTMPQTRGYAAAVDLYLNAGWPGVLPLPAGRKTPPPAGYTGNDGTWPDPDTYSTWRDTYNGGNIALRLPRTLVGIDVDHYGTKTGADTLDQLERDRGPLPATWTSTSRGVGPSCIRLYRIPEGLQFPTGPGPHIEFIQFHHRYIVVAPSTVDERRYRWRDPAGDVSGRPPRADDFPDLPTGWHDWHQPVVADLADNIDRILTRPEPARTADRSPAVARALADGISGLRNGTRHDNALRYALTLLRLHDSGHPGAAEALDDLGFVFRTAITDRATPAEADNEWRRIVEGGSKVVASTPATRPAWDQLGDPLAGIPTPGALLSIGQEPAGASQGDDDDEPALGRNWKAADLAAVWAGGLQRALPSVLQRDDGAALLYSGKTNTIFGESGAGKTWLLYIAAAQLILAGRHVIIIDFEDDAISYFLRLIALGVPPELVIGYSTYYPVGVGAAEEDLEDIDAIIAERDTAMVGIDSTGEALAAQGLNQDKDNEVAFWMGRLPRRWARLGPCVTMLDHMPHGGGREIGSQRKRAGVSGAAYEAIATEPFSKGKAGTLTLKVAKDRGGNYAKGTEQAVIKFNPSTDGTVMDFAVAVGSGRAITSTPRERSIADYEDAIVAHLEQEGGELSQRALLSGVPGDDKALKLALRTLVATKRVALREHGKSLLYSLQDDMEDHEGTR